MEEELREMLQKLVNLMRHPLLEENPQWESVLEDAEKLLHMRKGDKK